MTMWIKEEGLALAAELELKLAATCKCHFALGGSVMYAGKSDKDVDIIVYPHGETWVITRETVERELVDMGFEPSLESQHGYSGRACITGYHGKRVDFLFVG